MGNPPGGIWRHTFKQKKVPQHQNIDCKRCLSLRCDVSYVPVSYLCVPLQWRHFDHDGVSNHQPHGCLLNRLFRRRSKKTLKLRATGLCVGNSPEPVNSPHKGPVTRKMFPFDDVIMQYSWHGLLSFHSNPVCILWSHRMWVVTNPVFIWLPWWHHRMETFSALLAICAGNSPVPGEFPAKRPVTRSFDVFFDLE